ncbi:MAG TPA: hypothetical protein VG294_01990 [Solirubrobacteraceae bacterium]|nr:hypothetical protein [Solirubrobacteraceae bacterium]
MSTESAVVAAATAAVFSPRTRGTLRRGAVLGVAGVLKVGDVVSGAARGAARGLREEAGEDAASSNGTETAAAKPAPATRSRSGAGARSKPAGSATT